MDSFKPNKNFIHYLYWIINRQDIFWKRYNNVRPPFSKDPILVNNKFTNVYRVLDRTSQFLLQEVIYNGTVYSKEDMFWRILLFKHFNLPATWKYLCAQLGDIKKDTDITDMIDCLTIRHNQGKSIYSNAYMLTASFMRNEIVKKRLGIHDVDKKHEAYIKLFDHHIRKTNLDHAILEASSFEDAFDLIRTVPTVGDFLAYQYVQDWNYSNIVHFKDNDFCAAGFGTIRGIERTFDITGTPDYGGIVKWVYVYFEDLLHQYGMEDKFKPIPNWYPQVADLSNCFCETDKYLREAGITTDDKPIKGKRMKNKFTPNNIEKLNYIFPTKWGVSL